MTQKMGGGKRLFCTIANVGGVWLSLRQEPGKAKVRPGRNCITAQANYHWSG